MVGHGRTRAPAPWVKRRVPSGRGATEQPNAIGDGPVPLNSRFWAALALTGVAAGLAGAAMVMLLTLVGHLAFNYQHISFEEAVSRSSDARRLACLLIAAAVGGPAWYWLRRYTKGEHSEVDDAIWRGEGRLSWRRCLGTGVISEVVVGLGASLGREQAPKLLGAASGSVLSDRLRLTAAQRRVVVACGAGAGLAAVYNVPLGGAFFTVEVMLGSAALTSVLPALACAAVATFTAWVYLPSHAIYLGIPAYHFSASLLAWAVVVGPLIGVVSVGYIRLIGWVSYHRAAGLRIMPAMLAAFATVGLVGLAYPQVFGNGQDMARDAFLGRGSFLLLLALFALKPLLTALCLRSGASGGLFTPTLSTGAVLGAALGLAWVQLWPGPEVGAFAMVGAAAMVGASMQAPLAGLALVLELTHSGFELMVPMVVATVLATMVCRYADGYSIYSARLPEEQAVSGEGTDGPDSPGVGLRGPPQGHAGPA